MRLTRPQSLACPQPFSTCHRSAATHKDAAVRKGVTVHKEAAVRKSVTVHKEAAVRGPRLRTMLAPSRALPPHKPF